MGTYYVSIYRPEARIKRLAELEARLKPVLTSLDEGAGNDYPNQINGLRQALEERGKSIEQQLATVQVSER